MEREKALVQRHERLIDYLVVLGPGIRDGELEREDRMERSDSFSILPISNIYLAYGDKDKPPVDDQYEELHTLQNTTGINFNPGLFKSSVTLHYSRREKAGLQAITGVIVASEKSKTPIPDDYVRVPCKKFGNHTAIYISRSNSERPILDLVAIDLAAGEQCPPDYEMLDTPIHKYYIAFKRQKVVVAEEDEHGQVVKACTNHRVPNLDHPDHPLDDRGLAALCFPRGVLLTSKIQLPTFMTFVITRTDGSEVYAASLTFSERCPRDALVNDPVFAGVSTLYFPRCICLLSRWPFYTAFRQVLEQLYRISMKYCLEPYLRTIFLQTPLPRPGLRTVTLPLGHANIVFNFLPKMAVPHVAPESGLALTPLFRCLSIPNIITVWRHVLAEGRIILFSNSYKALTPVLDALRSLIFPLRWQCTFVPILPTSMRTVVRAPFPFLVGVHRSFLDVVQIAQDILLVDLDRNSLKLPRNDGGNTSSMIVPDMVPMSPTGSTKGGVSSAFASTNSPTSRYVTHSPSGIPLTSTCLVNPSSVACPALPDDIYESLEHELFTYIPLYKPRDTSQVDSSQLYRPESEQDLDANIEYPSQLPPNLQPALDSRHMSSLWTNNPTYVATVGLHPAIMKTAVLHSSEYAAQVSVRPGPGATASNDNEDPFGVGGLSSPQVRELGVRLAFLKVLTALVGNYRTLIKMRPRLTPLHFASLCTPAPATLRHMADFTVDASTPKASDDEQPVMDDISLENPDFQAPQIISPLPSWTPPLTKELRANMSGQSPESAVLLEHARLHKTVPAKWHDFLAKVLETQQMAEFLAMSFFPSGSRDLPDTHTHSMPLPTLCSKCGYMRVLDNIAMVFSHLKYQTEINRSRFQMPGPGPKPVRESTTMLTTANTISQIHQVLFFDLATLLSRYNQLTFPMPLLAKLHIDVNSTGLPTFTAFSRSQFISSAYHLCGRPNAYLLTVPESMISSYPPAAQRLTQCTSPSEVASLSYLVGGGLYGQSFFKSRAPARYTRAITSFQFNQQASGRGGAAGIRGTGTAATAGSRRITVDDNSTSMSNMPMAPNSPRMSAHPLASPANGGSGHMDHASQLALHKPKHQSSPTHRVNEFTPSSLSICSPSYPEGNGLSPWGVSLLTRWPLAIFPCDAKNSLDMQYSVKWTHTPTYLRQCSCTDFTTRPMDPVLEVAISPDSAVTVLEQLGRESSQDYSVFVIPPSDPNEQEPNTTGLFPKVDNLKILSTFPHITQSQSEKPLSTHTHYTPSAGSLYLRSIAEAVDCSIDSITSHILPLRHFNVHDPMDRNEVPQQNDRVYDINARHGFGITMAKNGTGRELFTVTHQQLAYSNRLTQPQLQLQSHPPLLTGSGSDLTGISTSVVVEGDEMGLPSPSGSIPGPPPPLSPTSEAALFPPQASTTTQHAPPTPSPPGGNVPIWQGHGVVYPSSSTTPAYVGSQLAIGSIYDVWNFLFITRHRGATSLIMQSTIFNEGPCHKECYHALDNSSSSKKRTREQEVLNDLRVKSAAIEKQLGPHPHSQRAIWHLVMWTLQQPEHLLKSKIDRHLNASASAWELALRSTNVLLSSAEEALLVQRPGLSPEADAEVSRAPHSLSPTSHSSGATVGTDGEIIPIPTLPHIMSLVVSLRVASHNDLLVCLSQLREMLIRRIVPSVSLVYQICLLCAYSGLEQSFQGLYRALGGFAFGPDYGDDTYGYEHLHDLYRLRRAHTTGASPNLSLPEALSAAGDSDPIKRFVQYARTPTSVLRQGLPLQALFGLAVSARSHFFNNMWTNSHALTTIIRHNTAQSMAMHHDTVYSIVNTPPITTRHQQQQQVTSSGQEKCTMTQSKRDILLRHPGLVMDANEAPPAVCLPYPAMSWADATCQSCGVELCGSDIFAAYSRPECITDGIECWSCGSYVRPRLVVVFSDNDPCALQYCLDYYNKHPQSATPPALPQGAGDQLDRHLFYLARNHGNASLPSSGHTSQNSPSHGVSSVSSDGSSTSHLPSSIVWNTPGAAVPLWICFDMLNPRFIKETIQEQLLTSSYSPDAFIYEQAQSWFNFNPEHQSSFPFPFPPYSNRMQGTVFQPPDPADHPAPSPLSLVRSTPKLLWNLVYFFLLRSAHPLPHYSEYLAPNAPVFPNAPFSRQYSLPADPITNQPRFVLPPNTHLPIHILLTDNYSSQDLLASVGLQESLALDGKSTPKQLAPSNLPRYGMSQHPGEPWYAVRDGDYRCTCPHHTQPIVPQQSPEFNAIEGYSPMVSSSSMLSSSSSNDLPRHLLHSSSSLMMASPSSLMTTSPSSVMIKGQRCHAPEETLNGFATGIGGANLLAQIHLPSDKPSGRSVLHDLTFKFLESRRQHERHSIDLPTIIPNMTYIQYFSHTTRTQTDSSSHYYECPRPVYPRVDEVIFSKQQSMFWELRRMNMRNCYGSSSMVTPPVCSPIRQLLSIDSAPHSVSHSSNPHTYTGQWPESVRPLTFSECLAAPTATPLRLFLDDYSRVLGYIDHHVKEYDGMVNSAQSAAMTVSANLKRGKTAAPPPPQPQSDYDPKQLQQISKLATRINTIDRDLSEAYISAIEAAETLWGPRDLCFGNPNGSAPSLAASEIELGFTNDALQQASDGLGGGASGSHGDDDNDSHGYLPGWLQRLTLLYQDPDIREKQSRNGHVFPPTFWYYAHNRPAEDSFSLRINTIPTALTSFLYTEDERTQARKANQALILPPPLDCQSYSYRAILSWKPKGSRKFVPYFRTSSSYINFAIARFVFDQEVLAHSLSHRPRPINPFMPPLVPVLYLYSPVKLPIFTLANLSAQVGPGAANQDLLRAQQMNAVNQAQRVRKNRTTLRQKLAEIDEIVAQEGPSAVPGGDVDAVKRKLYLDYSPPLENITVPTLKELVREQLGLTDDIYHLPEEKPSKKEAPQSVIHPPYQPSKHMSLFLRSFVSFYRLVVDHTCPCEHADHPVCPTPWRLLFRCLWYRNHRKLLDKRMQQQFHESDGLPPPPPPPMDDGFSQHNAFGGLNIYTAPPPPPPPPPMEYDFYGISPDVSQPSSLSLSQPAAVPLSSTSQSQSTSSSHPDAKDNRDLKDLDTTSSLMGGSRDDQLAILHKVALDILHLLDQDLVQKYIAATSQSVSQTRDPATNRARTTTIGPCVIDINLPSSLGGDQLHGKSINASSGWNKLILLRNGISKAVSSMNGSTAHGFDAAGGQHMASLHDPHGLLNTPVLAPNTINNNLRNRTTQTSVGIRQVPGAPVPASLSTPSSSSSSIFSSPFASPTSPAMQPMGTPYSLPSGGLNPIQILPTTTGTPMGSSTTLSQFTAGQEPFTIQESLLTTELFDPIINIVSQWMYQIYDAWSKYVVSQPLPDDYLMKPVDQRGEPFPLTLEQQQIQQTRTKIGAEFYQLPFQDLIVSWKSLPSSLYTTHAHTLIQLQQPPTDIAAQPTLAMPPSLSLPTVPLLSSLDHDSGASQGSLLRPLPTPTGATSSSLRLQNVAQQQQQQQQSASLPPHTVVSTTTTTTTVPIQSSGGLDPLESFINASIPAGTTVSTIRSTTTTVNTDPHVAPISTTIAPPLEPIPAPPVTNRQRVTGFTFGQSIPQSASGGGLPVKQPVQPASPPTNLPLPQTPPPVSMSPLPQSSSHPSTGPKPNDAAQRLVPPSQSLPASPPPSSASGKIAFVHPQRTLPSLTGDGNVSIAEGDHSASAAGSGPLTLAISPTTSRNRQMSSYAADPMSSPSPMSSLHLPTSASGTHPAPIMSISIDEDHNDGLPITEVPATSGSGGSTFTRPTFRVPSTPNRSSTGGFKLPAVLVQAGVSPRAGGHTRSASQATGSGSDMLDEIAASLASASLSPRSVTPAGARPIATGFRSPTAGPMSPDSIHSIPSVSQKLQQAIAIEINSPSMRDDTFQHAPPALSTSASGSSAQFHPPARSFQPPPTLAPIRPSMSTTPGPSSVPAPSLLPPAYPPGRNAPPRPSAPSSVAPTPKFGPGAPNN